MKANRQSLHTTDSFAFANHIPTAAAGANIEFVQRLDRHNHAAVVDLRPSGMVTLGHTENLVQYRVFHASRSYQPWLEKAQTFQVNRIFEVFHRFGLPGGYLRLFNVI
jgi:hypothetical protein